jgi:cytochrome P450
MTQFFGGASTYTNDEGIEVNQSALNLKTYFIDLIEERKKHPQNDFLSILIKNKETFGLTEDEIISQAIMMLVAGQITTTDQMCNNLYTLLTMQGKKHELWENPLLLDYALDELNRLDPAVTFIFRVSKTQTTIDQQCIKPGDVIFISTHAVNMDPRVFESPNECLFTRGNNKQISYGYGGHYCLGAKLAKREMKLCFLELIRAFPELSIHKSHLPKRKHHSLAFSGFEEFYLQFN